MLSAIHEITNESIEDPQMSPRRRAVFFGGGIGMFPPLSVRFAATFEVVQVITPRLPQIYKWFFFITSFRLPKSAWYRKWVQLMEHTPFSFRAITRQNERKLEKIDGQYDFVMFLGAMNSPGRYLKKPLFIMTDSCRWLSSQNIYDESCHFSSESAKKEWLSLEGAVYLRAKRIFVGSNFVRDALVHAYGVNAGRVKVTGFGAGAAFGHPYDKEFDGRSILYIGKGDFEKKGGLVLLRAFEILRKTRPDAVLHIVGQEGISPMTGVICHGFVSDREALVALMRAANVLVLPSLVDRFGIVLVEAMAAATPCIASDYGALPEIVGDAGLIVPAGDTQKLVEAMESVLADCNLAARLGKNGRRRFEEKYNWDAIWQGMRREILESLDAA